MQAAWVAGAAGAILLTIDSFVSGQESGASQLLSYKRTLSFSARLCASATSALRWNQRGLLSGRRLGLREQPAFLRFACGRDSDQLRSAFLPADR